MNAMIDVSEYVSAWVEFFGESLEYPVLVAPMGDWSLEPCRADGATELVDEFESFLDSVEFFDDVRCDPLAIHAISSLFERFVSERVRPESDEGEIDIEDPDYVPW